LFDNIHNLTDVKITYQKVALEEIGFRKLQITPDDVLKDTLKACYKLAERNAKDPEFQQLQRGINNFTNFTIQRFGLEEAIIASAKTAYLTRLLTAETGIQRYATQEAIKDWTITSPQYPKFQKLKKNNPEADYYWYQALNT
jgi:hypothetical protein